MPPFHNFLWTSALYLALNSGAEAQYSGPVKFQQSQKTIGLLPLATAQTANEKTDQKINDIVSHAPFAQAELRSLVSALYSIHTDLQYLKEKYLKSPIFEAKGYKVYVSLRNIKIEDPKSNSLNGLEVWLTIEK